MNHEQVRQDQMNDAARRTGGNNRDVRRLSPAKKQFVAKGHDAILKSVQDNRGAIIITTKSGSAKRKGLGVTLNSNASIEETDSGSSKTFYKHAIESFEPIQKVQ